ncbi:hypothetical protein BMT55_11715 [Listeria newyorkensis]|uniref:Uncharacterized protein n=1 Tax=Listeria newyorkensis TaxID=1497681 RepID=A0ABX4XLP9_9LIST|nr:hypothetical protein [Listeria newyorkensis]PNP90638.1 hypothetical protein BMT55_11715 [Listeria newyorkensis]
MISAYTKQAREQLKESRLLYRKHLLRIAHMNNGFARWEAQQKLAEMEETNRTLQETYLLATIADEVGIQFGVKDEFNMTVLQLLRREYELSSKQIAQLCGVGSDFVYQRIGKLEGSKK